jgi:hypothetical protein
VAFVGHTMRPSTSHSHPVVLEGDGINELVSLLLQIATSREGLASGNLGDISATAHSSLKHTLSAMHATDFVGAVLVMLESSESMVGALPFI